MSTTAPPPPPLVHADGPPDLPRTIGFWGATGIMVGIAVGSGIFATPPSIAAHTNSPLLVLSLWAVGGLLSFTGALTYAELATMYPQSGGVYVFLREGLGRAVAFVFGWTYMLLSKPLAAAGIAIVFAQHLNQLLGTTWDTRVTTSAALLLLTILNVRGMRLGTGVAGFFTVLKLLALLGIVALALILTRGNTANFRSEPPTESWLLALAPMMAGVLWTYDGWSDVGSIAGEVKDPQRQLPRVYLLGTAALVALYVAVNAVYIWLIPLPEMRGKQTIAPLVMQRLVGDGGAAVVALIVLVSTLGSTHGSIITGARITFAQARDGLLFRSLAHVHPRFRTPDVSLWFQCVLSCAAVWIYGDFAELAGGFVFTMWIFYGLAAAVIFVLRRRLPGAARPYRCWGYPVVPAVFIAASIIMTALGIADDPRNTLPWLAVLLAGLPIYFLWNRFNRPAR